MRIALALGAACTALALASPAYAVDLVYVASLSGPAESPTNSSPGTGFAMVTINPDALTMRIQVTFSGLIGATTASHIHCCTLVPFLDTAGVATTTPTFPSFPLGVTSGTYDMTFAVDPLTPGTWNPAFLTIVGGIANALPTLLAGLDNGTAYFNIHTSDFPGGEIRGFLAPVVAVPEPESFVLLLAGLGLIGVTLRRRRRR
jgi:hypothetical protein